MTIKLEELVHQYERQGHSVEWYYRQDGGIIVTKVDGVKFKGKQGNVFIREQTGQKLTQKQQKQLERIRTPKGTRQKKKPQILSDDLIKQLRRTQSAWRKKSDVYDREGVILKKDVEKYFLKYGEDETMKMLRNQETYAQGFAYEDNIVALIGRMRLDSYKVKDAEEREIFRTILHDLESRYKQILSGVRKARIKDADLKGFYDELYMFEKGQMSASDLKFAYERIIAKHSI